MDNLTLEKMVSTQNEALTQQELENWSTQPDRMVGYYEFPAQTSKQGLNLYRSTFRPLLHSNPGTIGTRDVAIVTTWTGAKIGEIISAQVYNHNFGCRMVSMRVRGTNGAIYSGRASWDGGNAINLHKVKA